MIQHIHSISEPSLWYLPNFNKWEWSYNVDFSNPAQNYKKCRSYRAFLRFLRKLNKNQPDLKGQWFFLSFSTGVIIRRLK